MRSLVTRLTLVLAAACLAAGCLLVFRGESLAAPRPGVIEGKGNDRYYWYRVVRGSKNDVFEFPVPRGYEVMRESDAPEFYRKQAASDKEARKVVLGYFMDSRDKTLLAKGQEIRPNIITIYFEGKIYKTRMDEAAFNKYKESKKEINDLIIEKVNKEEREKRSGVIVYFEYIRDDMNILSSILKVKETFIPVYSHIRSYVLKNNFAYTILEFRRIADNKDQDEFINGTLKYLEYFLVEY